MRSLIVLLLSLGLGLSVSRSTGESPASGEPLPGVTKCANAGEGGNCCNESCPQLAALKAQLSSLESQMRVWGDRGRVDLIEAIIYNENPSIPFLPRRDMAKAFVKTADKLQIPLLAGVAIADVETNFSNHLVGHHGEASLMQILPLPGRPSSAKLRSNPKLAIQWALENLLSPPYHQALATGKSPDEALKIALKNYNSRDSYVQKVYQRYLWMKDFEAKGLYGWE